MSIRLNTFLLQNDIRIRTNPCVSPDFCLDWPALRALLASKGTNLKIWEASRFTTAHGEWTLIENPATGDHAWRLASASPDVSALTDGTAATNDTDTAQTSSPPPSPPPPPPPLPVPTAPSNATTGEGGTGTSTTRDNATTADASSGGDATRAVVKTNGSLGSQTSLSESGTEPDPPPAHAAAGAVRPVHPCATETSMGAGPPPDPPPPELPAATAARPP